MINLMKNEFIKLFKKKSIYIILFITIAFIIIGNIMYKNNDMTYYSGYSDSVIQYYEQDIKRLDPSKESDNRMYIDMKSQLDMINLIKEYGFNSWQSNIIPEYVSGYISTMNAYTYSLDKTEVLKQAYDQAKLKYNTLVEKLDSNDWHYFVNTELEETTQEIQVQKDLKEQTEDVVTLKSINSNLNKLENEKQVLEWRLEKDISFESSFLNTCLDRYQNYGELVYTYEQSDNHTYTEKQDYYHNLKEFNLSKYYIENNIRDISTNDNRGILLKLLDEYELFILIFIVMIAGSIVSDEFSKGTIKLLLVRPYNRGKILLSKFMVCIITLILCITFIAVMQFVIGGIIQGFSSLNTPAIVYNYTTSQVETMNIISHICITALAKLPIYILLMTLAFACSTLFTNTAVSIVLPLLGYMASSIINQLALVFDIQALLYFVTPNWDFTQYLFGGLPLFEQLTVPFSLIICLIYFAIMVITSFIVFKKRNIKNI